MKQIWSDWKISDDIKDILNKSSDVIMLDTREDIISLALDGNKDFVEIRYDIKNRGEVLEATVAKCKNGLVVNYTEEYMRRRDPDCMLIGDQQETNKDRFQDIYNQPFSDVRNETFDWLKSQKLAILAIRIGGVNTGLTGLFIAPQNAGFFIGGVADLQGIIPQNQLPTPFEPCAVIYLAPPFRHTHFNGKQIVVHNRLDTIHEVFSYNLYPGPSAKKGIYGVLLNIGEKQGWVTLHASTVQVETPYENVTTILHEGASGSGKSEMLEYPHRELDGRLLLGTNRVTGEKMQVTLNRSCTLRPVTDDMALTFPKLQEQNKKLIVSDAEAAWFIRMNHITQYGTDPDLEKTTIHATDPLIFFNLKGVPNSTCLIWEHIEDKPGIPCPNPRVILPKHMISNMIDEKIEVDFRSFGIRAPVCTAENPSYGIFGLMHVLPPAIAWLWRLVAPRGDGNPSITTKEAGLVSEGVGSFWPFATGKFVTQANLLLDQIANTLQTRHILFPNQHIGAWHVGFMPQWIAREYLARRGMAKFHPDHLIKARSSLLGYIPHRMQIEGSLIPEFFFETNKQEEIGNIGYDQGSELLYEFFKKELPKFLTPELIPLGHDIIQCCLDKGTVEDYIKLIPMTL